MILSEFIIANIGDRIIFNRPNKCKCTSGCENIDANECEVSDDEVVEYKGELMPRSEMNELILDQKDLQLKEAQFRHQCT